MTHSLRLVGAIALSLTVAACATHAPLNVGGVQSVTATQKAQGTVTVPIRMPALDARGVQYAYNRNYVNTIEVRLRDSLGNVSTQYVVRNAYLATSRASGQVNVAFYNVMPGTFTLTVRTSHLRLLSADGPIKYDGLRDVFFKDNDADNAFDNGETEYPVLSGTKSSNFLIFAGASGFADAVFPASMRNDATSTPAGFGVGAATDSIVAGSTRAIVATVGTLPQWVSSLFGTTQTVVAGTPVNFTVSNAADVQTVDIVGLGPSRISPSAGLVDVSTDSLHLYGPIIDANAGTISITPTRTTNPNPNAAPAAWTLWLTRGEAASEASLAALAPKLVVIPDMVNQALSRIFVNSPDVPAGGTSAVQFDLRDRFKNPVAGNLTDINSVGLNTVRGPNSGITMDYSVTSYSADSDPRTGSLRLKPFFVPGLTTGWISGGTYHQGSIAPGPITTAATYSAMLNDTVTPSAVKLTRLAIPEFIWSANKSQFSGATMPHAYTLTVEDAPSGSNLWISLRRGNSSGVIVASASVAASQKTVSLMPNVPAVSPTPIQPDLPAVILTNTVSWDTSVDNGTVLTVTDYGARRVGDTDTVRTRVLNNNDLLFSQDVGFNWLQ